MEKQIVHILQEVVDAASAKQLAYLQTINPNYSGIRFDYGHPSDIVAKLVSFSGTEAYRYQKYPLIGLFLDFPQTKGTGVHVTSKVTLSMFIAVGTQQSYTPQQRTQNSFIPLLYPIRDAFFDALKKHPNVLKPEGNLFRYDQIDRYQWGKGGLEYYNNGQKNVFNDYIDAIELVGLEIDFKAYC